MNEVCLIHSIFRGEWLHPKALNLVRVGTNVTAMYVPSQRTIRHFQTRFQTDGDARALGRFDTIKVSTSPAERQQRPFLEPNKAVKFCFRRAASSKYAKARLPSAGRRPAQALNEGYCKAVQWKAWDGGHAFNMTPASSFKPRFAP